MPASFALIAALATTVLAQSTTVAPRTASATASATTSTSAAPAAPTAPAVPPPSIIVPISLPSCWYNPTFIRPILAQSDADLLAGSYDFVLTAREDPDAIPIDTSKPPTAGGAGGTTQAPGAADLPPSCYYTGSRGLAYWEMRGNASIVSNWQCSGQGCNEPCAATVRTAFPPVANATDCSEGIYGVLPPGSKLAPFRADAFSRFMIKDIYASSDATCSGDILRQMLVRVYDTCTLVSRTAPPASAPLYALSVINNNTVTQTLCTDAACRTCTTSQSVAPWSIAMTGTKGACKVEGLDVYRGFYFPVSAADTTAVVGRNVTVTAPRKAGAASPSATADAAGAAAGDGMSGTGIGLLVAGLVVAVALIGAVGFIAYRRRQAAHSRSYGGNGGNGGNGGSEGFAGLLAAVGLGSLVGAKGRNSTHSDDLPMSSRTKGVSASGASNSPSLSNSRVGVAGGVLAGAKIAGDPNSPGTAPRSFTLNRQESVRLRELSTKKLVTTLKRNPSASPSVTSTSSLARAVASAAGPTSPTTPTATSQLLPTTSFDAPSPSLTMAPMSEIRVALINYEPHAGSNELRLRIGDKLALEGLMADGWAEAFNLSTGEHGRVSTLAMTMETTDTLRRAAANAATSAYNATISRR